MYEQGMLHGTRTSTSAKRLIFFDIDGTLLDYNKRIPTSSRQAIYELKAAGHEIVLATGRSPFMLQAVAAELEIHSYVGFNGQYVVLNDQLVYANPHLTDELSRLAAVAEQSGHALVYLDHETMRASQAYDPYVEECMGSLKYPHPEYDPDFYHQRSIYQSMLFCPEHEEGQYRKRFTSLQFVRWHPYSLDVLPGGGSKANGIKQLLHYMQYDPREAYAFGDNLNDMEMLQYIGNSVAMGNSPEAVKQHAKYVTTDVDKDGIANGLRMVGLLP
ncbi:Cof-type HAD-IIB family hydrolase [Paenibacillus shunpengii]|uniref:Cof-type HAD-IIB family hydrolase n=1 Tax=Paenibacillus shunpengii TaxID=2054424 RepID=A0ABW5SW52_9BACL